MISIIKGMTSAEFITAVNSNFTELATLYDIHINSFKLLTATMTAEQQRFAINHNLRQLSCVVGQSGSNYISQLNIGFNTAFPRFQDLRVIGVSPGGEPSAIVSADGNTLDLFTAHRLVSTTDGVNFSEVTVLVIPPECEGACSSVMRDGNTYYMTRSKYDIAFGGYYKIMLLSSVDKIHWTYVKDLILPGGSGNWIVTGACNSFLWREGSNWFLIYEARLQGSTTYRIGLATSNAVDGDWVNYEGNPIIPYDGSESTEGDGRPCLATSNNSILKVNDKYFMYWHHNNASAGHAVYRGYSADLHNWTVEGSIIDYRVPPTPPHGLSNGDICVAEFKGKSYLFYTNNANGDGTLVAVDMTVDNRLFAELLALYP